MPGERLLDVACGTGAVPRSAAQIVGPTGQVIGLDLSPEALAVARSLNGPEGGATIEWREGAADALPFADGSFDVAACQLVGDVHVASPQELVCSYGALKGDVSTHPCTLPSAKMQTSYSSPIAAQRGWIIQSKLFWLGLAGDERTAITGIVCNLPPALPDVDRPASTGGPK